MNQAGLDERAIRLSKFRALPRVPPPFAASRPCCAQWPNVECGRRISPPRTDTLLAAFFSFFSMTRRGVDNSIYRGNLSSSSMEHACLYHQDVHVSPPSPPSSSQSWRTPSSRGCSRAVCSVFTAHADPPVGRTSRTATTETEPNPGVFFFFSFYNVSSVSRTDKKRRQK
ncbi:hypothetical protein LX36DRAFT_271026 [Colletotrichum falcatum]|nr:hypothetical protein LX36DRAFT_271026 [Colletotrichum falcatum]